MQHACLTRRTTVGFLLGSAIVRGARAADPALLRVEVMLQADAWTPDVGQSCDIDLSRAKVYPAADHDAV